MPVVVAFVSQKGGVGKSTLARATATVAANAGISVTIADLDGRQGTVLDWSRIRAEQNVQPTIQVAPYDSVFDALENETDAQVLLLDVAAGVSGDTLDICEAAHVVVVPTGTSLDDLKPTVIFLQDLVGAGIPTERIAVALCRELTVAEDEAARTYLARAGFAPLAGAVAERVEHRAAHNTGRSVAEVGSRDTRLAKLVDGLFRKIVVQVQRARETSDAVQTVLKRKS